MPRNIMPPEAQAEYMKAMTANALGSIMAAVEVIGWDSDDFFEAWVSDRDRASEELCERIDEHFEEVAVEALRRELEGESG